MSCVSNGRRTKTIAFDPELWMLTSIVAHDPAAVFSNVKKVLVIEDDFALRRGLEAMLSDLGVVTEESDGQNIAQLVETFDPDFILLDIKLGLTDAFAVMRTQIPIKFRGVVSIVSGLGLEVTTGVILFGERLGLTMGPPTLKPVGRQDLHDLVKAADELLGRRLIHEADMDRRVVSHCGEPLRLRPALETASLEVWYQPKFDLEGRHVGGAEALIRARAQDGRLVLPHELLMGSSQDDLLDLTDFLLLKTLMHASELAAVGFDNPLSLNVPVSYLLQADPARLVRQAALQAGWTGLIFELTEDEALGDVDELQLVAMQMKLYGIKLSIDDFGAAYSSLARLRDLPFDELKLDRSFVRGCAHDSIKRSICRSVLELGVELGVRTVAEGVETAEDLAVIADIGFDQVQGFVFSHPMSFEDLKTLVAKQQTLILH